MHDKAHSDKNESRGDLCIVRSLRLCSYRLGLTGVADIIEFRRTSVEHGVRLNGKSGLWQPNIVEYKLGKPKKNRCDEIQLCAQALCLEEMLNCKIATGQIYYGRNKRRMDVAFDDGLRELTLTQIHKLHEIIQSQLTPKAEYSSKCKSCSLIAICMPDSAGKGKNVASYLSRSVRKALLDDGGMTDEETA